MTGRPTTNASDAARAQFVRAREADHAELRASLGGERTWLGARRDEALAHFTQLGLPTRKLEDWRYTNVAPLAETTYTRNAEPAQHTVGASALPGVFEAVFVDGVFLPDASHLPDDGSVRFHTLEAARGTDSEAGELLDAHLASLSDEKRDAFSALNTAMLSDGAVVEIGSNASATRPLHLRFLSAAEGSIAHPRVLVVARAGSAATIIEEHASLHTGRTLSNAVTEIVLEANAALHYVLVESANAESFQISNVQARLARDARLRAHTLTLDGALTRNEIGVVLADTGAEVDLDALFLASGNGHVDNHTLVDHAMPHCTSRELYKGLLGDSARGVFRGRVIVRPDAQKTERLAVEPEPAALEPRGDRHEAAARDLRRRREVQPRLDHRTARPRSGLLSAIAGHLAGSGEEHARARLRERGRRTRCPAMPPRLDAAADRSPASTRVLATDAAGRDERAARAPIATQDFGGFDVEAIRAISRSSSSRCAASRSSSSTPPRAPRSRAASSRRSSTSIRTTTRTSTAVSIS